MANDRTTPADSTSLLSACGKIADITGDGFEDLDDARSLPNLMQRARECSTNDFAVVFTDDEAYSGFDLSTRTYKYLIASGLLPDNSSRWINVWYPTEHLELLAFIGKHYDFSPRLLALICSNPIPHRTTSSLRDQAVPALHKNWFQVKHTPVRGCDDEESLRGDLLTPSISSTDDRDIQNNIYRLASEIWHYTTMDFGRNYICIGFNSLYGVAPLRESHESEQHLPVSITSTIKRRDANRLVKACTRAWTWLILCKDGTVISINEDIFPQAHHQYTAPQLQALTETRRNLVNVFRSLSLVDSDPLEAQNPMRLLPIRARLGTTTLENIHHESDATGLLFYYLFENWQNSFTLITRKESRYGVELERLRKEMLIKPRLAHINRLHTIGQELGILKRHYQSYDRIIDRLLEPRPTTLASLQNSRIAEEEHAANASTVSIETIRPAALLDKESSLGVSIGTSVRVRFRTLRDLIDLYALSEIDEYLAQKDSLVSLNFNLLTFKESLDVEKLNRIALFLTKATFLFLPVSLMTSYFGVSLDGNEYTVAEFWTAFAVVLTLSWLALLAFGLFSGSVEITYVIQVIKRWLEKRRT